MSSKTIEVKTLNGRIILIVAGLLCLITGFFVIKWCVGNALTTRAEGKQIGELSVSLAPGDPVTHYTLARLNEKTFLPEDFERAVKEYEKAAALSPNDYRLWFQLGKARERGGDSAGAEGALRKSLELAPNYSEVQWTLGNLLLRQGNSSEAFELIRLAANGNERFLDPAVSIAWQIFDGDISQLKQNIGDSSKIDAALASFLLKQERFDESFAAWNSLPVEERKTVFHRRGEEIYNQLISAGKYRNALRIWTDIDGGNKNYEIGKITDGGFEINEKQEKKSVFDWHIADGAQPLIGVDTETVHGGNLSQRIIFNSPNGADFRQVFQVVAVEAGRKYEFSMFYRSDLKTDATLKWEIVNASDGKVLTTAEPIAAKTDWANLKTDFTAPETGEAVIIRLARAACSSPICPISGSVWFDDFVLSAK
jgi:tetratricopeptide (TPR) repeat protein